MTPKTFSTPMMRQYAEIKKKHQDCLLFFRLGDFYELFLEDAKVGADVLDITLTKRPRGKDGHIPMAGVPYHVADTYVARLVSAGHKVAICEQMSEPDGKGIVEREVVRIVTPGTLMDEKSLDKKSHNYTMSLSMDADTIGIAAADISTGDFQTTELPANEHLDHVLLTELARFNPKECILSRELYDNYRILKLLASQKNLNMSAFESWDTFAEDAMRFLKTHFGISTLNGFGIHDKKNAMIASAALLGYLQETQKSEVQHVRTIKSYIPEESVVLDRSTIKNLELFTTIHEGKKKETFIHTIDKTISAMGARKIREWVKKPLIEKRAIERRLDATEELIREDEVRHSVRELLTEVYDVERVISRLSVGVGNPVDLIHLSESIAVCLDIREILKKAQSPLVKSLAKNVAGKLTTLVTYIQKTIVEDPPFDPKNGNLIQKGIDKKLDKLRGEVAGSKDWLMSLEQKERKATGIPTLKVAYNKVFGYYIEISKGNLKKAPAHYMRKQTLVNAERFITDELKKHEDAVLTAEEKISTIEYELFERCIEVILTYTDEIQAAADAIAEVDSLVSFAEVALLRNYTKPHLTASKEITITEGRHPVVETTMKESFVPNDTVLNTKDHQMIIITGPNMAGKSVYMRQVALITLMAHMGMYVPAREAKIGIVDRIFVRSGASDIITSGLSTFMLEMVETAHILNHATDESLIVMDEVGRGTSTYDGISLAWAIASHLVSTKGMQAKTLFATHYHELTELENEYPKKVKNYHLAVDDKKGSPVFLYTVVPGGASASYGVAVATLAGIPQNVTKIAKERLAHLETHTLRDTDVQIPQNSRDTIRDKISQLSLDSVTPLAALNMLSELQKEIRNE